MSLTTAQDKSLSTLERIRVAAALGQSVTFSSDAAPKVLEYFKSAEDCERMAIQFHKDGVLAFDRAAQLHKKSIRNAIIGTVFQLSVLAAVLVLQ